MIFIVDVYYGWYKKWCEAWLRRKIIKGIYKLKFSNFLTFQHSFYAMSSV